MSWSSGRSVIDPGRDDRSVDVSLEVLADPYRRAVISRLDEMDDVSFDRLVDQVIDAVDRQAVDGPSAERSRVAMRLYHLHLPKLVDAGFVDHDDWETFAATERTDAAARLLDRVNRAR